jgi:Tc toxin complex TcA C-terminal TcB-binding domain/Neuraminidase-like domain/Salmonella virulence plasmid 28.1kDa A protein
MPAAVTPILYTVSGIVYDEHNSPLINGKAKLFEVNLRSEKPLGKPCEIKKGIYGISFNWTPAVEDADKSPDILIKVFSADNKLLGQSIIYFNVQQETTIDYKIGGTQNKGTNEFDLLLQKIDPVIKPSGIKLGQLEENEQHKDISFIAGETGEDVAYISFINTAFAFFNQTKITSEIFYGLFRMGFPTVLNELLMIKAQSIANALKQAVEENIISGKWQKSFDEIIKTFNGLSVKKLVEGNDEQSKAIKKLLGAGLTPAQQKVFTATWFDNEETPEKFWDNLKLQTGFNKAAGKNILKAKQMLQLNQLTGKQPDLAAWLYSKQSADNDLKEMSGYAKYSKADWAKHIKDAKVKQFPAWVQGENEKEKTAHYAESLEALHKQLYPTTFFATRMKQDGQSSFAIKNKLTTFFKKNPDFELNTKNIHKQLAAANFENAADKAVLTKELKTINRLYKLTDDYKQVNELYGKQLFSSIDIVTKYGREQFVKQFTNATGSAEAAAILYAKAVSVNNKTTAVATAYKMRHDTGIYAIDGGSRENEEHVEFWKGYYEMFGDGELCECEHCQSVYSPSAYFVDMLHFIKSNKEKAYDELLHRRPDLDDILLTCKNTNTPLPYIDLVNELLEKEVLRLSGITEMDGVLLTKHSYQTEGIAAELMAMPEHSNSNAYEPLKLATGNAVFSPVLPVDFPLEEIRAYTEKLGWKRAELMQDFYGNNGTDMYSDVNMAAALFGFSTAELNIINGSSAFTVTLPVNDDRICIIKTLLEKTKLSYIELLQLLETYFLNPVREGERKIKIKQLGEEILLTCNLDKLFLEAVNDAWLKKMVRFVRLWKKLGWDIFDLDRIITALKPATTVIANWDINNQLIISLANIEKARQTLHISLKQATALFSDIDTVIYLDHTKEGQPISPSLHDDIFKGMAVNDAATVCAAFNISATDFEMLHAGEDFTLPNLSRLYRNILLARALGTSISDLKKLLSITAYENEIWQPQQLCQFLQDWKIFSSLGIKADDFETYFITSSAEEYTIPVSYDLIKQTGDCISGLKDIKNNAALTEDKRKVQSIEKVNTCLQSITENVAFVAALNIVKDLDNTASNPADKALYSVAQNYLGDANKKTIEELQADEMIIKMEALKRFLLQYAEVVLKKAPAIFQKLSFSTEEIIWLKENTTALGIEMEADNLFNAAKKLQQLSVLAKSSKADWMDLLGIAINNEAGAKAAWFTKCISLYAVVEPSLEFLCGSKEEVNNKGKLHFSFPTNYANAKNILTILKCRNMIEKIGGNNEQLSALFNNTIVAEDAQAVKNLLKSKYGNIEWLDIIKPINDKLRTKRRDALQAWLLANSNGDIWHTSNDLYEWLLIDTEMAACMVTSRIKQGISSVQLFIDRCLMNLEKDIDKKEIILGEEFSEQWHTWRKQYRVWEANRKIFLYPENWIEPDLRDDKSSFFKELESQLKQNEVIEDTAKEALITYLQKLDTVANLEMVGLFNDEETNIVHVFGRTHNIPHQYFYRKQENNVWTAWEKVEVDIEGDHILPVVWNGRLMLFWGMFTEKQVQKSGKTSIKGNIGNMAVTTDEPQTYFEMKLAWSEFKNGKWGAKKISKEACKLNLLPDELLNPLHNRNSKPKIDDLTNLPPVNVSEDDDTVTVIDHRDSTRKSKLDTEHVFLSSIISGSNLHIKIFQWDDSRENELFWRTDFIFNGCNSSPELFAWNDPSSLFSLQEFKANKLTLEASESLIINEKRFFTSFSMPEGNEILAKPLTNSIITIERDSLTKVKRPLFFLSNKSHTFFAKGSSNLNSFFSDDFENVLNNGFAIRRTHNTAKRSSSVITPTLTNSLVPVSRARAGSVMKSGLSQLQRTYSFQVFYYSQACSFIKKINLGGVNAMYSLQIQEQTPKVLFNETYYNPSELVLLPFPQEELEYAVHGAYSLYNWELFYHIPLLIATRLTQNQKFEEARNWFHYIFDPTKSTNDDSSAKRFWITKPFRKEIEEGVLSLEDLLTLDEDADELEIQLSNWENNPFNPHAVARLRISAYMRNTVLRYIDNLIQWGDQLFKRDTIESINEATLLYILASNILGKKQETVPARAKPVEQSFSDIKNKLDRFSNVKSEIETYISPSSGTDNILMPYFCLPKNDFLLKYWDTVADRLFKIRHCMNIEGVVRQLPLFEPPIDPALLVRATAAGLNLNEILNDMNTSLPNYRFQVMLQQANELCNDVKSLGGSLLSALEKKDGEEMALLRSSHELRMLEMIKDVKEKQRDEAKENLEGLNKSKVVIEARETYYSGREFMNIYEKVYFASIPIGMIYQNLQMEAQMVAAVSHLVPESTIGPFSVGVTFGGANIGDAATISAGILGVQANVVNTIGVLANTYGSFKRREDDWKFQAKSAQLELKQIDKQIIAAEIRLAIAEKEMENHSLQMEQSKEMDDYMRGKFTNTELYDWMVGQLSTVYFQSYQMAYATAKKAEKCLQYELGLEGTNYVQFGYWDSLKKGLLSGEKLQYDLRRLENAYLEENKREYEIVKHVSLVMLDPLAIVKLRSTGSCDFEIPEVLYDMDHPGQYFRRLKSVSISLPCIAGPYTSVSANLSLTKSQCRIKNNLSEDSLQEFGKGQSIATSNAQNDSGVFELNFRDERYLPFEGTGAISNWKLELPSAIRQFDYNTISDVIIHVKYTTREGSSDLKSQVNDSLKTILNEITQQLGEQGLHIALNMKHDLSNEWYLFKQNGTISLTLDKTRLPYMAQTLETEIVEVMFIAKATGNLVNFEVTIDGVILNLAKIDDNWQLCKGISTAIALDTPFTLTVAEDDLPNLEELMLVVKYSF